MTDVPLQPGDWVQIDFPTQRELHGHRTQVLAVTEADALRHRSPTYSSDSIYANCSPNYPLLRKTPRWVCNFLLPATCLVLVSREVTDDMAELP